MKIEIGRKAPGFSLFNTEKKKETLEDYKGRNIVLLFFPFAFSGVCTKELCSVRDSISVYNNLNVSVIGISVDSLYTLARFKEDQRLTFTLLSDFNKETSQAYGAFYENFSYEMKGVSRRAAFVIDSEGILRYAEVLESAGDVPDFEAVKHVLDSMKK